MTKAGDLVKAIFGEEVLKDTRAISSLYTSWDSICASCGLSAASGHSRILELEKGNLLVEADHPGWIQLLQVKQGNILEELGRRFPEQRISGIFFRLSV